MRRGDSPVDGPAVLDTAGGGSAGEGGAPRQVLTLEGVSRSFGPTVALAPVSLSVTAGAICAVVGPNGSGKTTLLRIAAGLTVPTTGRRTVDGTSLYLSPGDGGRRAQTPAEAVRFAARLAGTVADDDVLETVGLAPHAHRPTSQLSAGQRARMTIAIALACRPVVACLDEPTAHLDDDGGMVAGAAILRLASSGTAVLVATHDGLLPGLADARLHLRDGRVVEEMSP
jgi:ABC-type multidrug transport system ATPase subunit